MTKSKKQNEKTSKQSSKKTQGPERLKKNVERTFDEAVQMFKDRESIVPVAFLDFDWVRKGPKEKETKSTSIAVALMGEDTLNARRSIMGSLGAACAMFQALDLTSPVVSVRFVAEAWFNVAEKGTKPEDLVRPSEDPNKREIVFVSGVDSEGNNVFRAKEIHRYVDTDSEDMTPKIELSECKEMDGTEEVNADSPLFDVFWRVKDSMLEKVTADESHKVYRETAKETPQEVIQTIIQHSVEQASKDAEEMGNTVESDANENELM